MEMWKSVVIGLGKIGLMYEMDPHRSTPSSHSMAYHMNHQTSLVGAADFDVNKKYILQKVASEAIFFSDMKSCIKDCDPDIVSVCTPQGCHLENIQMILEIGNPKVIFCEKPLVSSLREAEDLIGILRQHPECILIPNISRRWCPGMRRITDFIKSESYGRLEKIHIRYTRGIYNTGSHLFDLLCMWSHQQINLVQVLRKVHTTSDFEQEPSYSFYFEQTDDVYGYAEAINDENYYMFEIDLYFTSGKLEVRNSGDDVFYYRTGEHHLFSGYRELICEKEEHNLLKESCLSLAVENIVDILCGKDIPFCTFNDALYPMYVAEALELSYKEKRKEKIIWRN